MSFLTSKNLNFLRSKLKTIHSELHYDQIDMNMAYTAKKWYREQPTTRDIERIGGLYELNEDFIKYFSMMISRKMQSPVMTDDYYGFQMGKNFSHNGERVKNGFAYDTKLGHTRAALRQEAERIKTTNEVFSALEINGMKLEKHVDIGDANIIKHKIFRGITRNAGVKRHEKHVVAPVVYHTPDIYDDIIYNIPPRRKFQYGKSNQSTGQTLTELSSVAAFHPKNYNHRFPQPSYPTSRTMTNYIDDGTINATEINGRYDRRSDPMMISTYITQPKTRWDTLANYKEDMMTRHFPHLARNRGEYYAAIDRIPPRDRDFAAEKESRARSLASHY
jgi:hypothetical protein